MPTRCREAGRQPRATTAASPPAPRSTRARLPTPPPPELPPRPVLCLSPGAAWPFPTPEASGRPPTASPTRAATGPLDAGVAGALCARKPSNASKLLPGKYIADNPAIAGNVRLQFFANGTYVMNWACADAKNAFPASRGRWKLEGHLLSCSHEVAGLGTVELHASLSADLTMDTLKQGLRAVIITALGNQHIVLLRQGD